MRSVKAQRVADYPLTFEYTYSWRGRPIIEEERFPYPRPRTLLQERSTQVRRRQRKMWKTFWLNWIFHQGNGAYISYLEMRKHA